MDDTAIPEGFKPAAFTPGFLDHGGPYFLGPPVDGVRVVGLRIMPHHINYQDSAHGGVISTLADVALSHAVYDAERPRLAPSTVTLTVNYLAGARLGDWLEARVRIDRLGGRTAYTSGGIWRGEEQLATMSGVFAFRRP
ncbi:PaaI family thioesterase [Erythrobacter dokdonensis]|uniref:Thioesterase superfamily protein n=1 Tax=Erythrobacter dokdonensis DSW-74 TaxID=1300349 RepID=A0A1A7BGT2_9SPHN|nr:PaaI family thioesterase [Erythrobacter dokdonensis]OBV10627.1 Thioesterase superfamily protein [Erythrobacter dokdonensis DSW-74]